jgi:hypothetical protein
VAVRGQPRFECEVGFVGGRIYHAPELAVGFGFLRTDKFYGAAWATPESRGKTQCHDGREVNPRPYTSRVTCSFTLATMSRWSLMGTWYSPITLMASVSWILRLSIV